jgi:hypothetical protein
MQGFPAAERHRIAAAADQEAVRDRYLVHRDELVRMLDNGGGPDVVTQLIAAACWYSRAIHGEVRPAFVVGLLLGRDSEASPDLLDAIARASGV